jgi:hypothetical protein
MVLHLYGRGRFLSRHRLVAGYYALDRGSASLDKDTEWEILIFLSRLGRARPAAGR